MRMNRLTLIAFAGLAAVGMIGCSSKAPESPEPTKPAAASCTKAGLEEAATAAAKALGKDNLYTLDDVKCADDWAVTSGLLSSVQNPNMGAPTSMVFEQHEGQWTVQEKAKVCGTNAATTPAPADAKIPGALYEIGCLAG